MPDPFTLVPNNLGCVADVTGDVPSRYSVGGVHVALGEGSYEVCATDGRRLALVRGPSEPDPLAYPPIPELVDAPPSQAEAVVPAKEWKQAFRQAPRGKLVREHPILGNVAVHLGDSESLLASTDGEDARVTRVRNLDNRFPPYRDAIPAGPPAQAVSFDPRLMLDLLRIAGEVCPEDSPRVTLEFHGPGKPLVLRSQRPGQHFLGLLMPLVEPAPAAPPAPAPAP